jgi:hypothetical protein
MPTRVTGVTRTRDQSRKTIEQIEANYVATNAD